MNYPFFELEKKPELKTATLYLNNPEKKNLLKWTFWEDLPRIVADIEADNDIRTVVIAGRGGHFSIGIDFKDFFVNMGPLFQEQSAEGREKLYRKILVMQSGFTGITNSSKVYISAVSGYCIGGGLDLISACDLRVASSNSIVSLRETKVGIVADMGSLSLLPRIIGEGNARLMAFTGDDFTAAQCKELGLFNFVYDSPETALSEAQKLAEKIAANSSITVRGTKNVMNYGSKHTHEDAMNYVAAWNAAFLDSADLREAIAAFFEKRPPRFL